MATKATVIFLVLFSLFISACGSSPIREITPLVSSPTNSTLEPSHTPITTLTPSPNLLPFKSTSRAYLAPQQTAVAITREAMGAVCKDGYQMELPELVIDWSNQQWTIFTCSPSLPDLTSTEYQNRYTQIVNYQDSKSWTISHEEFYWSNQQKGMYLRPYRWTQGEKFVYLIPNRYPGSGFYGPGYLEEGGTLYRLDLNSGAFQTIMPEKGKYKYSLSPDNRYLVYANPQESNLFHLQDMITLEDRIFEIGNEYTDIGAFAWQPDSAEFVFAAGIDGWRKEDAGISLFEFSLTNMNFLTFSYGDTRQLIPFYNWEIESYWLEEDALFLRSIKDAASHNQEWVIDTKSGQITPLPTPIPRP